MGEVAVAGAPSIISSLGLGSCVAVALYDTRRRIGGLAHIMLPGSASFNGSQSPCGYADPAITALLKALRIKGAVRKDIVAKMVGGARMFSNYGDSSKGIGGQCIESIKDILKREQIPVIGEDTGGHHGRNIEFYLDTGRVVVSAIGKEDKEI